VSPDHPFDPYPLGKEVVMFESLLKWWYRSLGKSPGRKSVRRPRRRMLTLEALEDRCVPTAITYIQGIGTAVDDLGTSTTLSIPVVAPVAQGHDIIVQVVTSAPQDAQNPPPINIADSTGNTYFWSGWDSLTFGDGLTLSTAVCWAPNVSPLPAGASISVNFPSAINSKAVSALEFYGLDSGKAGFVSPSEWFTTGQALSVSGLTTTATGVFLANNSLVLGTLGTGEFSNIAGLIPNTGFASVPTAEGTLGLLGEYQVFNGGSSTLGGTLAGYFLSPVDWMLVPTIYPGDQATHFLITPTSSTITAGDSEVLTVTVLNADGSIDTGYHGDVHFTSSDGSALLPDDYYFTPTDAGQHTFSCSLQSPGSQTVTAGDTIDTSLYGTATIKVNAGPITQFSVSAPATVPSGAPFSITVTALNAYGQVVSDFRGMVTFASLDTQALLPPSYTFTGGPGGDNGVHTFAGLILETPGSQSVSALTLVPLAEKAAPSSAVVPLFTLHKVVSGTTNILVLGLTPEDRTASATEGMSFNGVVGSFTDADPNGLPSEYVATIDWSDGSPPTPGIISSDGAGFDVSGSHTYAEEGTYIAKVSIMSAFLTGEPSSDAGEAPVVAHGTFTVADAPLTALGSFKFHVTGGVNKKNLDLAKFTDTDPAGVAADYTIIVNWGDNTSNTSNDGTNTVQIIGTGPFAVIGSHTYAPFPVNQLKTITVIIEDHGSQQQITDTVVDPPAHGAKPKKPPAHSHHRGGATSMRSAEYFQGDDNDRDNTTATYQRLLITGENHRPWLHYRRV
jgi:hypothetical protein